VSENIKVKILVCHHKEFEYISNDCILPIQVGRVLSPVKLDYCIGDDSGTNISAKNKSWCELTAIFWAWKNLDADYYGLMHYRRYLSMESDDGFSVVDNLNADVVKANGLSAEAIITKCKNYDVITSPVWNVHPAGLPSRLLTNYQHYELDHYKKDLDIIIDIVKKNYPDFYLPLLDSLHSTSCFFANIAIMKKEYFHEYCDFAFGVLFEAESMVSLDSYDNYQKRIWGFLAERLINAYVIYAKKKYKDIKIKTAGLLYVTEKNTLNFEEILTKELSFAKNNGLSCNASLQTSVEINICMSFNDNYFVHALTTIQSLIANNKSCSKVKLFILCDAQLSQNNRNKLSVYFAEQIDVSFLDVDPDLFNALPLNRHYISLNTYYRLVIHKLIPEIDRVIYLDSDIIFCDDITELWSHDLQGKSLAGSLDEGGVLQSRRLQLGIESSYINAGVLIMDLNKIREKYNDVFIEYMANYFTRKQDIILQDQDILNLTYNNDISLLPLKWNVNSRMFCLNDLEHKYSISEEMEAINDLGIIHFTDRKKPWNILCSHPLRKLYWYYRGKASPETIKLKERLVRQYSGRLNYQFEGDKVLFDFSLIKFRIKKIIIIRLIQVLKLFKLWK